MIWVIVPAHNEEAVIRRSLGAMTQGMTAGDLQAIVVCNGCADRTAEAARACGPLVQVIETTVASKVHALNLGDAEARGFPRFYIDADVMLTAADLKRLAAILTEGKFLAVAPRFKMQLEGCSWFVRAFYDINDRMPSSREGIGGSGVYGLSEEGRKRFGAFPPLTADDGFVRLQFRPQERLTVEDCFSSVFAPRTLWELIHIKTRSHYGTLELRQAFPQLWENQGEGNRKTLQRLAGQPTLWPKLAVYLLVKLVARWRAQKRLKSAMPPAWERDESSRTTRVAGV